MSLVISRWCVTEPGIRASHSDGGRWNVHLGALVLVLVLFATPPPADAQQQGKVYRIGFLANPAPTLPEVSRNWDAFRQGMRELGWIEGQNWVSEPRWADSKPERLPALAGELVRLNVDLILVAGTPAVRAASHATQTIPIVMASVGDAEGAGLVSTLARPGANVTGMSFLGRELGAKYLDLLKATVPTMSRVAVLWDSTIGGATLKETIEASARALRLQLQLLDARRADDYRTAFASMSSARAEGLVVFPMGAAFGHRVLIVDLSAKHRLPAIYGMPAFVEAGGLMAYAPHFPDLYRRAAIHVDKILKGASPATLPVEQPVKFELVINRKTATTLGLTIPASVMLRADQIHE